MDSVVAGQAGKVKVKVHFWGGESQPGFLTARNSPTCQSEPGSQA